jgi:hypothetical protein
VIRFIVAAVIIVFQFLTFDKCGSNVEIEGHKFCDLFIFNSLLPTTHANIILLVGIAVQTLFTWLYVCKPELPL